MGNRNFVIRAVALACFSFIFAAASLAMAEELEIEVVNGSVQLQARDSDLTADELNALKFYLDEKMDRTPFGGSGEMHATLSDETLAAIKRELRQVDVRDPNAVDRALNRAWDNMRSVSFGIEDSEGPQKILVGQSFTIGQSESYENVVAIASKGIVKGTVANLVSVGSDVEVASSARVTEALVMIGSSVKVARGAQIDGEEVRISIPPSLTAAVPLTGLRFKNEQEPAERVSVLVGSILISFALAALLIAVFPSFTASAREDVLTRKTASFFWGLLGYFALIPVAIALILTIIGILLLPFYAAGIALLIFLGHIIVGMAIGQKLPIRGVGSEYWKAGLGIAILKVAAIVPWFGALALFFATTLGFGAALRYLLTRAFSKTKPSAPAPETPGGAEFATA